MRIKFAIQIVLLLTSISESLSQERIIISEYSITGKDSTERKSKVFTMDKEGKLLQIRYFPEIIKQDSIQEIRSRYHYSQEGVLTSCETFQFNLYGHKTKVGEVNYFYKKGELCSFKGRGNSYQGVIDSATINYYDSEIQIIARGINSEIDTLFFGLDSIGRIESFRHKKRYKEGYLYCNAEYVHMNEQTRKKFDNYSIVKSYNRSGLLEEFKWYKVKGAKLILSDIGTIDYRNDLVQLIETSSTLATYYGIFSYDVVEGEKFIKKRRIRQKISKLILNLKYGYEDNLPLRLNPVFQISMIGMYSMKE